MALEAWEVVVIAVIIILLLKPSIVRSFARSLGRIFGEYRKGKSHTTPRACAKSLGSYP